MDRKNLVVASTGRPPWYNAEGKSSHAYLIGIAGGSASGKTRVAQSLLKELEASNNIVVVSQDNFYKSLSAEDSELAFESNYNFDEPSAFDYDLLAECILALKGCKSVQIPNYSFQLHQRTDKRTNLYGATVVIVEGLFTLFDPAVRNLFDLKIFVECDSDIMLARRLQRDILERGRSPQGVIEQYLRFVKPAFDNHIHSTRRFADLIVPGSSNEISIDVVTSHIHRQMSGVTRIREELFRTTAESSPSYGGEYGGLPGSVTVMKQTPQLQGIHTLLRDVSTTRESFTFLADRLATLLIEATLNLLPYRPKSVATETTPEYHGAELAIDAGHLCGVSILRSGASLEAGLRLVVPHVAVGSILIQSDDMGEPLLFHTSLPSILTTSHDSAATSYVLLLDSQIGTGSAAMMAIRVLLDHGVREDRIILCAFLVARIGGIWGLRKAFPMVRIVTSCVDPGLEERWISRGKKIFAILPGMGSFGERYYG